MNALQKDAWGYHHLMVDHFDRALFVDDVSGSRPNTRNGVPGYLAIRCLLAPGTVPEKHEGAFLLGAKEVQQLHEMCSEILAKLSAEALR